MGRLCGVPSVGERGRGKKGEELPGLSMKSSGQWRYKLEKARGRPQFGAYKGQPLWQFPILCPTALLLFSHRATSGSGMTNL